MIKTAKLGVAFCFRFMTWKTLRIVFEELFVLLGISFIIVSLGNKRLRLLLMVRMFIKLGILSFIEYLGKFCMIGKKEKDTESCCRNAGGI